MLNGMPDIPPRKSVISFPRKVLRWVLQIFIGGIFFLSALGKSLDVAGFIEVLKTYQAFPPAALGPLAVTVTGIEFILGVWIIFGYRLPLTALAAALLNTGYAVWMVITLLRGLTLPNCGCFGVFFPQPLTWVTPLGDFILVGMCVVLAYLAQTEDYPHRRIRTALLN